MHLLKDTIFKKIVKYLKKFKSLHTKNSRKLRIFIEAVYYLIRSGCQWRLLPQIYGNWRAVHKRFKAWNDRNIWKNLFELSKVEPDMELTMIDSTIVRAHACAAGYGKNTQKKEALGRSSGGFTTKLHAIVDALGNPLKFSLTPGQAHDSTQAHSLTQGIKSAAMAGDKAYDYSAYIDYLNDNDCIAVIPVKKNRLTIRLYDKYLYRERHQIECFFGKIKHFRRVFSRYEKSAQCYLSVIYFVSMLLWLK